jgi:type II secretory pathway component PulF
MNIDELLQQAREIWGDEKLTLEEIIIRQGVTTGDIHRYARDKSEGADLDEDELKKEMGNIIFSTLRWCDDLGFGIEECLELAKQSQARYRSARNSS